MQPATHKERPQAMPAECIDAAEEQQWDTASSVVHNDSDVQAYLESVREEAWQLDQQQQQLAAEQQPSSVISADDGGGNTSNEGRQSRKRCAYVSYLLALDERAGDKPLVLPPEEGPLTHSSHTEGTVHSTDDSMWRCAVLKAFARLRQYLKDVVCATFPNLSGEGEEVPNEREWDSTDWLERVQSEDVTLSALGAMDAVRAAAVLAAVATLLKRMNIALAARLSTEGVARTAESAEQPDEANSTQDFLLRSSGVCPKILSRVLCWGFAALVSLDLLQSVEADTAASLQIVRRCCRWLKALVHENVMYSRVRLLEVIVQDFFHQR